jgi:hypothetical protein
MTDDTRENVEIAIGVLGSPIGGAIFGLLLFPKEQCIASTSVCTESVNEPVVGLVTILGWAATYIWYEVTHS